MFNYISQFRFLKPLKSFSPRNVMIFLAILGPGIITANVDNDAGGITTYSLAGSEFGLRLLWSMLPITGALPFIPKNVTVLVAAGVKFLMPVSCVEAGRWRYQARHFESKFCAPPSLRNKKMKAAWLKLGIRGHVGVELMLFE